MDEQIIIKSYRCNVLKIFLGCVVFALIAAIILWFALGFNVYYQKHLDGKCNYVFSYYYDYYEECPWSTALGCVIMEYEEFWLALFMPCTLVVLFGGVFCLIMKSMEIIVTDKRVTGKTFFGKVVDLPLDSVSAVASSGKWGISISTSSGAIRFCLIKNAKEIHNKVRDLIVKRQENKNNIDSSDNVLEKIRTLKQLCDEGIITQEEFEVKKKALLGI